MKIPAFFSQKNLLRRGWIWLAATLCLPGLQPFSSPAQPYYPSTNDLWDISQGSVVTANSPLDAGNDGRDMFGGTFGTDEYGRTIFADGEPAGFVHYIQWQTPTPVTIGSFVLFAAGDGPQYNNEREFAQFVLKAKSSALATNYDLTLYTLVVSNHPYTFVDPVNQALVAPSITPVTAQYFRAEFTQYTAGRGFDGPRIIELDGFGANPPVIQTQPASQTVPAGENATFAVSVTGAAPLSYQWVMNGSNVLAAATNATLVLTNVQFGQAGNSYSVMVSNVYGLTNSTSATLTVISQVLPSTNDLWDISQGSVLTSNTPVQSASDPRNMFGGEFGSVEIGKTIFADGEPAGFVHTIEWQTPEPVNVGFFALFAAGDGPASPYPTDREFAQFVLKAKSSALATNYDLTLYTLVVTNHPYDFVDPVNQALVVTNITPVTAQYFQAEFTQFNAGHGYDGPRILELDGYQTGLPAVISPPAGETVPSGGTASFSVALGGLPAFAYQWQLNGTNISAEENPTATNATLVLTNTQFAQSGSVYSVVVSNLIGSTNSSKALLNVLPPGSCWPPPSGLVSWWSAEDSAIDSAGTNNGALVGGVKFAPGEVGQAFQFNGSSGYVSIPASTSLNVGTNGGFTVEGWIKPASPSLLAPLVEWENGPGSLGWSIGINEPTVYGGGGPGSLYANLLDVTGTGHVLATAANLLSTSNFNHVAVTYDKSSGIGTLYLNGTNVTSQNLGIFTPQTTYGVVLGYQPPSYYYSGLMDEMSLYNRALSSNEIQAIYEVGSAGKCEMPLVAGQPMSQVGFWGGSVTLTVNAAGTGPFYYQWEDNDVPIAGQTNATLFLNNLQFTNAGGYSVVISNLYGTVTSAPAYLSVSLAGVSLALYPGVTINGMVGLTYGIQYNTNLNDTNDWLGLTNLTLTQTNVIWYDSQPATQPQRYYRVVPGPISIP